MEQTLEEEITHHLREKPASLNELRFLTGEKGHILLRSLRDLEGQGIVHVQYEGGHAVFYLQEEFEL